MAFTNVKMANTYTYLSNVNICNLLNLALNVRIFNNIFKFIWKLNALMYNVRYMSYAISKINK